MADIPTAETTVLRELSPGHYQWTVYPASASAEMSFTEHGLMQKNWEQTTTSAGFTRPAKTKLVYTRSGAPEIQLSYGELALVHPETRPIPIRESAKGMQQELLPEHVVSGIFYDSKLLRTTTHYQLWAVTVYAARFLPDRNSWQIPSYIRLDITSDISDGAIAANEHFINGLTESESSQITLSSGGWGQGKFKLYLLEDGIYRIYYDSLLTRPGFPEEAISAATLTLTKDGEAQPMYVQDGGDGIFDEGDYFDFIGQQNYYDNPSQYYDPFSDINVYWLDWGHGNGLRFIEESGALNLSNPVRPTTFWDNVHVEKDSIFDRLGQVDTNLPTITRDHYFWNSVNSGRTASVAFTLHDPFRGSSENVQISIGLHGLTYSSGGGEESSHTLFAFLNGNSIGEGTWTQQEAYTLTSPSALNLSHNILSAGGNNVLSVFAPVSTEPGNYDRIVLNWMEIGYEHLLKAHHNSLRFRKSFLNPSVVLEFEVKGFDEPELVLYKQGLSRITGFSIRENWETHDQEFSLVFQDQVSDATPDYWVSTVSALHQPVLMEADTSADLRTLDGDMIVITTPEFMSDIEAYLDFKTDEGWTPAAVSIKDIYDEFNYGVSSPYAVKDFLRFANNNWPSHPEFALLIGDASSNPQEVKRDTRLKSIPTFYIQTLGWGAAESDFWYTLLNGDDYVPDIALGRLPCNSSEDLETTLTKLMNYAGESNFGTWQNELVTIAGFETTFKSQSESLLRNNIPEAYMPSRIFIDRDSEGQIFWGDTDSLVAQWNAGKLLINFLGHGGGAVWADRSLFVRNDIQYLDADTPPAFVTSMTCFTSSFAQVRGLGEVVLTESPAGAVGWFGSSGVGWVWNDYFMIQPLLRRLLEEHRPVGEIINAARMDYFFTPNGYDYLKPSMLFQYNYLGDPTTRLPLPEPGDLLHSEQDIYAATDQLRFSADATEEGLLRILPVNADNAPWWPAPTDYETGTYSHLLINQEDSPPMGESRLIYTLDRGTELPAIQGAVPYAISADWFEHVPLNSDMLSQIESFRFPVNFHSAESEADSVVLTFNGGESAAYQLEALDGWWTLPDGISITATDDFSRYYFSAYENGMLLAQSKSYLLYLNGPISLSVSGIEESHNAVSCGVSIKYTLTGTDSADVQLMYRDSSAVFQQARNTIVTLVKGQNSLFVPVYFGGTEVVVAADFILGTDTSSYSVSFVPSHYQLLPGLGLTMDGQRADSLELWGGGKFYAANADSGWIRIKPVGEPEGMLPGVTLYRDSLLYALTVSNPTAAYHVQADLPVYFKPEGLPVWQQPSSGTHAYAITGKGILALGEKTNSKGPDVSMMIAGQMFFDGDYLLQDSRLDLMAEDENGFAWDPQQVRVLVDDTPVDVVLGDTTASGRIMSVCANLQLTDGEHQISYQVSDALGNWSELSEITGIVSSKAQIVDYGNFPNPFEGETLLIYELTQPLDEVKIEIFTLSGYKLHTLDVYNARVGIPLGAIGYHEVPWNGRDAYGDFVANGVYFYRIKGQYKGDTLLGPIGKMVKNR